MLTLQITALCQLASSVQHAIRCDHFALTSIDLVDLVLLHDGYVAEVEYVLFFRVDGDPTILLILGHDSIHCLLQLSYGELRVLGLLLDDTRGDPWGPSARGGHV